MSYFGLFGLACATFLTTIFLFPKEILKDKEKEKNKEFRVSSISKENKTQNNNSRNQVGYQKKESEMNRDINNENPAISRKFNGFCKMNGIANNGHTRLNVNLTNFSIEKDSHRNADGNLGYVVNTFIEFDNKGFVREIPKEKFSVIGEDDNVFGSGTTESEVTSNDETKVIDADRSRENIYCNGKLPCETETIFKSTQPTTDDQSKNDITNGTVQQKYVEVQSNDSTTVDKPEEASPEVDSNTLLKESMCGYLYLFNVLWFTVIRFRTNYFYGTINPLIEEITNHDEEKGMLYL